jgi:two-component system, chemotaxis family, protein-glutamate methylesterase/glutaminase
MSRSAVVVIGASAGGLEALTRLASQLPADFPAPIFVVHHMAADTTGVALLQAINKSGTLACTEAHDGVLLTGYLDDGTAGMTAIHRCGGVCVVQDPGDAAYPDMPQNALNRVKIDHTVPLAEIGALLVRLLHRRTVKDKPVPKDIAIEAKIAERVATSWPAFASRARIERPMDCVRARTCNRQSTV